MIDLLFLCGFSLPPFCLFRSSSPHKPVRSKLLSLGRYLFWWANSHRGYHPSSSQCFSTDMLYYISTCLLLSQGLYLFWWTNNPQGIIHLVVSVSVLTSTFLLLLYVIYLFWWTNSPQGIIPLVVSVSVLTSTCLLLS